MNNNAICAKFAAGNIKLGNMLSFSKLYGNDIFSTKYGAVLGTCGGYCAGCKHKCYVRKSYRYGSVINAHARNTLAFRDNLFTSFENLNGILDRKRVKPDTVRINQSGVIESPSELVAWIDLAIKHPESNFYLYTKNGHDLALVIENFADYIPDNFTILISVWHEYGIDTYKKYATYPFIKAYVYMDGFDYNAAGLEIQTMCHAYDASGKLDHDITCDKCRKCFNRIHKVIGCNEH